MEIRVLRYFLAVASEQSISGAAETLHLTQPTLSRQLMELEKELGTTLFIRGNRSITLTDDGMLLRKRAEEILELVEKTEAELQIPDGAVAGDIYIGGGESHAMRMIADVIQELRKEHPLIRYHFFSGNAEDVTERLDRGLLDFGVLIEPTDLSKYESMTLPAKDVWGVLMRRDSPLAAKQEIRPEDLREVPLIGSRQRLISGTLGQWFQAEYERLNLVATYNLVYNASLLVKSGVGYALCLDKLVNTADASELCFRPLAPRLEAGMYIVWKRYQMFSRASEAFRQKLLKALS